MRIFMGMNTRTIGDWQNHQDLVSHPRRSWFCSGSSLSVEWTLTVTEISAHWASVRLFFCCSGCFCFYLTERTDLCKCRARTSLNNPLASSSFLWVANVLRDSNCIPGIECSHVLTHFILPIAPRGEDYHFWFRDETIEAHKIFLPS